MCIFMFACILRTKYYISPEIVCHTMTNPMCMFLSMDVKDNVLLAPNNEQFISSNRYNGKWDLLYPSPRVQHVPIKTSVNRFILQRFFVVLITHAIHHTCNSRAINQSINQPIHISIALLRHSVNYQYGFSDVTNIKLAIG